MQGRDINSSDVVETETWLKLRDRDFIKNSETPDLKLENSKFGLLPNFFKKNVVITSEAIFFKFLALFRPVWLFLTCKYSEQKLVEL